MPGPDPTAISLSEDDYGRPVVTSETGGFTTNRTPRHRRARAIVFNILRDDWLCRWCREPVPLFRRADARSCGESCRKKTARLRRHWLEGRA